MAFLSAIHTKVTPATDLPEVKTEPSALQMDNQDEINLRKSDVSSDGISSEDESIIDSNADESAGAPWKTQCAELKVEKKELADGGLHGWQGRRENATARSVTLPKATPRTSRISEEEATEVWEDECMRYLEREPDFRARLQYEVRVVVTSSVFKVGGRNVSTFTSLYERKFKKSLESSGFTSATRLCRAMPHVIDRTILNQLGRLHAVDSPQNHRIIAGIRSGLRRVVYDALKLHPDGVTCDELEEECSKLLGQPLSDALMDVGYHTPSVQAMLRDMLDLAFINEIGSDDCVFLSKRAEDPALTDGILFGNIDRPSSPRMDDNTKPATISPRPSTDHIRSGPAGMCYDELADLQMLRASEMRTFGNSPLSSGDSDEHPQWSIEAAAQSVRLRLRLLLALRNQGKGVELSKLATIYQMMFSQPLDLQSFGLSSIEAMANCWDDVVQQTPLRPGWVFPVETAQNRRVLNTVSSGLRSAIFAILLARYPEGIDPQDLVSKLEEHLSAKFPIILGANGYLPEDASAIKDMLGSGESSNFKLADCKGLKSLLHDMDDFVRFGCHEDGILTVKLRDGDFPLLDLLDCDPVPEVSDAPIQGASSAASTSQKVSRRSSMSCLSHADYPFSRRQSFSMPIKGDDLVTGQAISSMGAKMAYLQFSAPPHPPPRLEQQIRLILGSHDFIYNGMSIEELHAVYEDRTGKALELGNYKSEKDLVEDMPDVIDQDLFSSKRCLKFLQSGKNLRILSITKTGLRQVLFWALLKNPGGIWAELLEGWYEDFAGTTLSKTLTRHGYEKSGHWPLHPVYQFLLDMSDLIKPHPEDPQLYIWDGNVEDPIVKDALLLNNPVETLQYDPLRKDSENMRSSANLSFYVAHGGRQLCPDHEDKGDNEKSSNYADGAQKERDQDQKQEQSFSNAQSDITKDLGVLRCMVTPQAPALKETVA